MTASPVPAVETLELQTLNALFQRLPRDLSDDRRQSNLDLIKALGQPERVVDLLQGLVADDDRLAEIAGRSYRHANHFDKIVLVDSGNPQDYRLTLHLWNPPYSEAEVNDEQIHNHRFSFWSSILVGELKSQNYLRSNNGMPIGEYQYVPEKRDVATVGNFYRQIGQARLLEVEPSVQPPGSAYYLPFHQIHRVVIPRADMTCTLVLRGPRERDHTSVFSNTRRYDPLANVMFTPAELASRCSLVAAAIKSTRLGR